VGELLHGYIGREFVWNNQNEFQLSGSGLMKWDEDILFRFRTFYLKPSRTKS